MLVVSEVAQLPSPTHLDPTPLEYIPSTSRIISVPPVDFRTLSDPHSLRGERNIFGRPYISSSMEQGFVPTIGPRLTAVDIEDIMCDLGVEIRDQGLVDAIRAGDADAVQRTGLELRSPLTSRSKEEAILLRRLDFLRLLLERDDYIDEHMVAESCRFRDHEAISTLLEFGWPINKSVRFAASMLRYSLASNFCRASG